MQQYLPLTNFLKHQSASSGGDPIVEQSINAQIHYLNAMMKGQLSEQELARRAERMRHLKRRFSATFGDYRAAYQAKTSQAVASLTEFREQRQAAKGVAA